MTVAPSIMVRGARSVNGGYGGTGRFATVIAKGGRIPAC